MSWTKGLVLLQCAVLAACWHQPLGAAPACPAQDGQALRFVDVFDGPAEELAMLIPDTAGARSGHWQLGYVYDAGRFVTLRCKYADGRAVDVRLVKRVKACTYTIGTAQALALACR